MIGTKLVLPGYPSLGVDKRTYPPPAGSVLWLPGYPPLGSTIRDFSGNNNHGTITGATWSRLPSGLWVLNFDGADDIINCGSGASLAVVGTWECLIKRTNNATPDYVCDFRNVGGGAGYIVFGAGVNDITASAGTTYADGAASATMTPAVWHHLVVAGITFTAGGPLIIGRRWNAQDWLVGSMGLVGFHAGTWSAAQVAARFQQIRHLIGV